MTTAVAPSMIDKEEALRELRATVPEFTALLRGVKNPNAHAIGEWSVRDVAAHMTDVFENYRRVAEGKGSAAPSIDKIGDYNEERVNAIDETDIGVLAGRIDEAAMPYLDVLSSIAGDPTVAWTELEIPVSTVIAIGISECLVHGFDIAVAEKRPWRLDPHKVAISLRGLTPITVHYLDPEQAGDMRACFDLRLRGQTRLFFIVEDGKLSIEEPSARRIDVHISADPAAFMLVGYGRISQWGPIAKGQLLTWGRKPWLAFKFGSLLKNP